MAVGDSAFAFPHEQNGYVLIPISSESESGWPAALYRPSFQLREGGRVWVWVLKASFATYYCETLGESFNRGLNFGMYNMRTMVSVSWSYCKITKTIIIIGIY